MQTLRYSLSLLCALAGCSSLDSAPPETAGESTAQLRGDPTFYPIVLVHGFNSSPGFWGFNRTIVDALCDDGHEVFVATLPPYDSTAVRSTELARQIDRVLVGNAVSACGGSILATDQVNLLCHSMGGLDCRDVVSRRGYGDRVASVTTISTPHGGSAVADMALGLVGAIDDRVLNALAKLLGTAMSSAEIARNTHLRAALQSLSEANAPSFNASTPDDDRVFYQSWAGLSNVAGIPNPQDVAACEDQMVGFGPFRLRHVMHTLFVPVAAVVAHGVSLIPNDGMVQVERSKWGWFRGCFPADHADEVGGFFPSWPSSRYVPFYRELAFELSSWGF